MKTLDGYILQEGDGCYVRIECAGDEHHLSPKPRKAKYLDENAKAGGWEFTLPTLRVDCEEVEITHVWKNNPAQ